MFNFEQLFEEFEKIKIGIVGDVMLDTYWWGNVDRISPEAPVPVVALKKKEFRIGGAGNVALNTVALGAQTSLFSVIGNDEDGSLLVSLLNNNNINTGNIVRSEGRVTTNKIRIMARNQQIMRLDAEITREIDTEEEDELLKAFTSYINSAKPDVIIFEDYNKGVLTGRIIMEMIAICKEESIITAVDPKRKNFFSYKGVTIFKPNIGEVKDGLNLLLDEINTSSLENIHNKLAEKLSHEISLITLSEKGVFYQDRQHSSKNFSFAIATVPTSSQTSPPAILAIELAR